MKKLLMLLALPLLLASCTMTFQNIDTHGTATDLVDENLSTTPTVQTNLNLPVNPLKP